MLVAAPGKRPFDTRSIAHNNAPLFRDNDPSDPRRCYIALIHRGLHGEARGLRRGEAQLVIVATGQRQVTTVRDPVLAKVTNLNYRAFDLEYLDVERAKRELPTGGTIAHGYLTLSLIPWLGAQIMKIDGVSRGINYGSNKVRFTNMVPVGSKVRAKLKLLNVDAKAGGKQLTSEYTIEIQGQDRPACVAETIGLVFP